MKEMSIADDHLVVLEMVFLQTFDMTIIKCAPSVLVNPPELCVAVKKEPKVIEHSDCMAADQTAKLNVDQNQAGVFAVNNHTVIQKDEGVPIAFRTCMKLTIPHLSLLGP
ncbi:hypothetical protein Hanom_Chr15g01394961 [Helianthus anomalus]